MKILTHTDSLSQMIVSRQAGWPSGCSALAAKVHLYCFTRPTEEEEDEGHFVRETKRERERTERKKETGDQFE